MIRAWYEKIRDQKDCVYFAFHEGYHGSKLPFPSFHNSIEFAFVVEGTLDVNVSGTTHRVTRGEVVFIDSREPHKYTYYDCTKCYIVLISSGFFTDANQLGRVSFATHSAACEQFEYIKQYLDYAIAHWDGDSFLCKLAFVDTFMFLMTRYYQTFPKRETEKQISVMLEAVKYICEHYREDLKLGDVAKLFGYSKNYFSAAFNTFMGESFPDYVNACRMIEYYRLRREQPELAQERAVELSGFGSMRSFYRTRKKFSNESADPIAPSN